MTDKFNITGVIVGLKVGVSFTVFILCNVAIKALQYETKVILYPQNDSQKHKKFEMVLLTITKHPFKLNTNTKMNKMNTLTLKFTYVLTQW